MHGTKALSAIYLTAGPLGAQQALPNPLGQPLLDASGPLRDDAFIRIPFRPEDERYADIEGDRLKEMLLEVDAISLADRDAGTIFWGRNVGTASHVAIQDWVEGHFHRLRPVSGAVSHKAQRPTPNAQSL